MIIKITYPFKNKANTMDLVNIFIKTQDKDLIHSLKSTNDPIELGIILAENKEKYKKIPPTKEDLHIEINEVICNPEIREKFNF
jgi:hypothetical protein